MGPQIQQVSTLRLPTDGLDFLLSPFLGRAIQLFPQKLFLFFCCDFEVLRQDCGERSTGLVNQDLPLNNNQTSNN